MCSKAVKVALEEVPFVEKVTVDIKNQQYTLTFRDSAAINFDALAEAVEEAGFSVASLRVTAELEKQHLQKDDHVRIGDHYFHFLNASNQQVGGTTTFSIVDKNYVSEKEFKKYSGLSSMKCVQTGTAASCCSGADVAAQSRIYHVII
jgi:copper chaperone CopZ